MTTTETIELNRLALYPTAATTEPFHAFDFTGHRHTPFSWLLEFAKMNNYRLRQDDECGYVQPGYFVETQDGVHVFSALISY